MKVYGSSGEPPRGGARARPSPGRARARVPRRALTVASEDCPLALPFDSPVGGSMTITVRSSGRRSRTAAIFASCDSSSQTIAQAPESAITQWHSSGELVW